MKFHIEITFEGNVYLDCLEGLPNVAAAKSDALLTMTEILRSGLDGSGRAISVRISDNDHRLVAAMSMTLTMQDG